jgi:DNA-binding XRE family transcriptional regulator
MFHKATSVNFLEGTSLEVRFQDGQVKQYDMAALFTKYPQLEALKDRELFESGYLLGSYGITWNDDLDIETETIYQDGITVQSEQPSGDGTAARAIAYARKLAGLSQKELAIASKIDQSDISKIERGVANPSISTLQRLADAMGGELVIRINFDKAKETNMDGIG